MNDLLSGRPLGNAGFYIIAVLLSAAMLLAIVV